MYNVWYVMYNVWCVMYGVWYEVCHVWCIMGILVRQTSAYGYTSSSYTMLIILILIIWSHRYWVIHTFIHTFTMKAYHRISSSAATRKTPMSCGPSWTSSATPKPSLPIWCTHQRPLRRRLRTELATPPSPHLAAIRTTAHSTSWRARWPGSSMGSTSSSTM